MSEWKTSGSIHRFRIQKHLRQRRDLVTDPTDERMYFACERCKRLKKKCDRQAPQCRVCEKAGARCQFPDGIDAPSLSSRYAWLAAFVETLLPHGVPLGSVTTGADLGALVISHASSPDSNGNVMGGDSSSTLHTPAAQVDSPLSQLPERRKLRPLGPLPQGASLMDLVHTYFNSPHHSYPFLDQAKITQEAESSMYPFEQETIDLNPSSISLYLIMSIGYKLLYRGQAHPPESSNRFQLPYHEVIDICLRDPSFESLQLLLLLTIFSTFDPLGLPPYVLTSLLGRQIMTLGLNRRINPDSGLSLLETEYRYRLFWSIFTLDRQVSVAYGVPFGVDVGDRELDVPLPGITMEEFATSQQAEHSTNLRIARGDIAIFELEGRILSRIHLDSYGEQMPERKDRHRILQRFRTQAENWYSNGCLLTRTDTDEVPVHTRISWLNVSFHGTLALLYCPSYFNSSFNKSELLELQRIIRKFVDSTYVYLQDGNYVKHHLNLNRLLIVCRINLHCYSKCFPSNNVEQEQIISKCIAILKAYAPVWTLAKHLLKLLQRYANILESHENSHVSTPSNDDSLHSIITQCESLILENLGSSSVYGYFAEEIESNC